MPDEGEKSADTPSADGGNERAAEARRAGGASCSTGAEGGETTDTIKSESERIADTREIERAINSIEIIDEGEKTDVRLEVERTIVTSEIERVACSIRV